MTVPIQMQGYMAVDLAGVFVYDMPTGATIGTIGYTILLDDLQGVEADDYGGPELIDVQRVHFKTTDLAFIELGSQMVVAGKTKIVVSSITSADGNELIVTVRGA